MTKKEKNSGERAAAHVKKRLLGCRGNFLVISQVRSRLVKKSLVYLYCAHMVYKNLPPKNKRDLSRRDIFFLYERNCLGKRGIFYCSLRRRGKVFPLTEEIFAI